jgi:hypothetical protein
MYIGWGGQGIIQNFDVETPWKTANWIPRRRWGGDTIKVSCPIASFCTGSVEPQVSAIRELVTV